MLDPEEIDKFLTDHLNTYMTSVHESCSDDKLRKCLSILQLHADNVRQHLAAKQTKEFEDPLTKSSALDEQNGLAKCGLKLSEIQRYSRQLLLPELRVSGQLKLKAASVLIVGAGGLGCPAALYLAAAGIGRIGIVDADTVDLSNLHRQVAHKQSKLGKSKSDSLCQAVNDLNTGVQVVSYQCSLTSHNALKIFNDHYDVILDATDNPATRYLINDACQLSGKVNRIWS